ncbi:hypothetical protein CHS0354_039873 [Potamilus streckersoni]|uniref:Uncharacterized protein n=1 Tax=Potamilus streckersoni TaxID=2493646 RepID=A0AAE0SIW5_9BIVA|nr:hypothetical protein CHS0354_039873 [Potamilus streckersoni]
MEFSDTLLKRSFPSATSVLPQKTVDAFEEDLALYRVTVTSVLKSLILANFKIGRTITLTTPSTSCLYTTTTSTTAPLTTTLEIYYISSHLFIKDV